VWVATDGPQENAIAVVDAAARKTALTMPNGVISRDFTRLYAVVNAPGGVALETRDAHTGALLRSETFPGNYWLPYMGVEQGALSPDGHWLVLDGTNRGSGPATTSTFVVVDTTGVEPLRRVSLDKDFLFDGISNSGLNLFLLENLGTGSIGSDTKYHVRRYDMLARQLDPQVIVDKQSPDEQTMNGTAISHANSADGTWQYTVYAFGDRGPVVHALDLEHGVAACIDLPRGNNSNDQMQQLLWSLAADSAHHRLYAVNGALGSIAVIDIESWPRLAQQATVTPTATPAATPASFFGGDVIDAQAKRIVLGGARLSPDGATLYAVADASVLVVDTATLRLRRELLGGRAVVGMALSGDGRFLWAAADGTLLQLDLAHGGPATTQAAPKNVSGVLRVEPVTP
jgi:hypothetical protein